MTAYHPQTSGQVERYSGKIVPRLQNYVAELQHDCAHYTRQLTYSYNKQCTLQQACLFLP